MANEKLWMILGGVGLFLIGMHLMENAIARMAGRNFKRLLRRNTSTNFRALLSGVLTTSILQSSSVVSFLTLAFVGSGMIALENALAVVLGANIGTTVANWVIATLGFSVHLEAVWYLILGLAGLALVLFQRRNNLQQIWYFFIGLSFLFLALGLMKDGMLASVEKFNLSAYTGLPPIFFVLIGFGMTFLVQSSSATMAITLSAVYAQAIPFHLAAALVIGSELGTSLKMVLAAVGASAEKMRLAVGNILLNLLTTILAFAFLHPLIHLIQDKLNIKDPLQGLVAFQSIINIAAALLFFPFLHKVSGWLQNRLKNGNDRSSLYLDAEIPALPGFAQEVFRLESFYFLKRVMYYHARQFQLTATECGMDDLFTGKEKEREQKYQHLDERYADIKKAHGELIEYYVHIQKHSTSKEELAQVNQEMKCVHSAMYAAKGFKDINHNKHELLESANDEKFGQFEQFSNIVRKNIIAFSALLKNPETDSIRKGLITRLEEIQNDYAALLSGIYRTAEKNSVIEKDISTLQNMNRELYSSTKSMIYAVGDFMLNAEDAEHIRNLPLTVR
jgi:phosphate:Na+ symporter